MSHDTRAPTPEDMKVTPKTREAEKHIEIEGKIIRTKAEDATPEGLQRKIAALGGVLEIPRRLLQDISYRREKKEAQDSRIYLLALKDFVNPDDLARVCALLGLTIIRRGENEIAVRTPGGQLPKRSIRLRRDGEQFIWGVKEPRAKGVKLDERAEEEVGVLRPGAVDEILGALGYARDAERQKYRTTYRLKKTLVELNEGPKAPPWIEVEGIGVEKSTADDVYATVKQLGYAEADCASLSDADYYRSHGVSEEELKCFTFAQEK